MALSKKEALIKARDEWEARNAEQKAKYDAQHGAFRSMTREIFGAIERKVAEGLGEYSLKVDIKADTEYRDNLEVRVSNEQNRDNSSALLWSWEVRIDKNGAPVFESNSRSGLCVTNAEQVLSLKETACTLEILMSMDWTSLLSVELPKYEKFVTENSSIGQRPNFEADIRAAEIAELLGTDTLIKGMSSFGRGTAWYFIVSETPKQFKVAELHPAWVEDEYLQERGLTIAQVVETAKNAATGITKERFLNSIIGKPIETMTF